MNTLHDNAFLGIPALEWIKGLGIAAVVIGALWGIKAALVNRLKNAAESETWVDDLFLMLAGRTSRVFMLAMGITAAALYESTTPQLPIWLRVFTVGAFCLQLLHWANGSIGFWLGKMNRSAGDDGAKRGSLAVVSVLCKVAIFLIVLVLALDNFGINVTALITGLGITGIAVALAVQNILGDVLAALAIAFDKPFVVGDEIQVGDMTGRVERVGLKTTRLRIGTGEEVSVPNAEVMRQRLTNISRTERRMLPLTIGIPAVGMKGEQLLQLAEQCAAAAGKIAGVVSAKASLQSIVDGRARILVESVLETPRHVGTVRPLLVAAMADAAATETRPVLGVS